jgi:hypothetical protein
MARSSGPIDDKHELASFGVIAEDADRMLAEAVEDEPTFI